MDDLRAVGVDILTLGPVPAPDRQSPPGRALRRAGGIRVATAPRRSRAASVECVAGPLVRSSYRAEQALAAQQRRAGDGWHRFQVARADRGPPPVLRWLGLVDYEPTWRAMQRQVDSRGPGSPRRVLVPRASAGLHAGHEREAGAPARARRHPGSADRPRRPGHLPRAGPARRVSADRPRTRAARRACARGRHRARDHRHGGRVGHRGRRPARRAGRVRRRPQARKRRTAHSPGAFLPRACAQRGHGPRAVPPHQPLRLRGTRDDAAERARRACGPAASSLRRSPRGCSSASGCRRRIRAPRAPGGRT